MSSIKAIFDALTSDSSLDGCDPDWCREVLNNASSEDLAFVKNQIGSSNETDRETETRLRRNGHF